VSFRRAGGLRPAGGESGNALFGIHNSKRVNILHQDHDGMQSAAASFRNGEQVAAAVYDADVGRLIESGRVQEISVGQRIPMSGTFGAAIVDDHSRVLGQIIDRDDARCRCDALLFEDLQARRCRHDETPRASPAQIAEMSAAAEALAEVVRERPDVKAARRDHPYTRDGILNFEQLQLAHRDRARHGGHPSGAAGRGRAESPSRGRW
jgi:hypothetical protein